MWEYGGSKIGRFLYKMSKHFPNPTFGKFVWVPNSPEFKIPVCAKDIFVPFSPIVSNCPKIWWDAFKK